MLIILVKEKDQLEPKKKTILPEKEGIDKYKPRYLVSVDQFVVNTPGILPTEYIQDSSYYRFLRRHPLQVFCYRYYLG